MKFLRSNSLSKALVIAFAVIVFLVISYIVLSYQKTSKPVQADLQTNVGFHRTGGILGVDDNLNITPNGHVALTRKNPHRYNWPAYSEFNLDQTTITQLATILNNTNFPNLQSTYLPANSWCCDLITYEIAYQGHTIKTMSGAIPPQLRPVITGLDQIIETGISSVSPTPDQTNNPQATNTYLDKINMCLNSYLKIDDQTNESVAIKLSGITFIPGENKEDTIKCLTSIPEGKRYYGMLQFYGPILQQNKDLVTANSVVLLDYIPNFAFFAEFSNNSLKNINALKVVKWIGVIPPKSKVLKDLWEGKIHNNWTIDNAGLITVNIRFFKDTTLGEKEVVINSHQGVILSNSGEHYRIKIQMDNIKALANENIVDWIEPYVQPT